MDKRRFQQAAGCTALGVACLLIPFAFREHSPLVLLFLLGPLVLGAGIGGIFGRFGLGALCGFAVVIALCAVFVRAAGHLRRGSPMQATLDGGSGPQMVELDVGVRRE